MKIIVVSLFDRIALVPLRHRRPRASAAAAHADAGMVRQWVQVTRQRSGCAHDDSRAGATKM
jgi:hypothetical protein